MQDPVYHYDYEIQGVGYSTYRATEPAIARYITEALGYAATVLNVGAGTGSYEPEDRMVVAVEPSATMRSQRKPGLLPAVNATAEALPFDDNSFDASMAMLTIHHWSDLERGLREMRRVTKGPVVIITFDIPRLGDHWLTQYGPELVEIDLVRFPTIDEVVEMLGGTATVTPVSLPFHCKDGILEAFYGRPEAYLDKNIRSAQSIWGVMDAGIEERIITELAADLQSGTWDKQYGHYRHEPFYDSSMRVITSQP